VEGERNHEVAKFRQDRAGILDIAPRREKKDAVTMSREELDKRGNPNSMKKEKRGLGGDPGQEDHRHRGPCLRGKRWAGGGD